ncbi:MAG: hypothetical protein LUG62_01120 [Clostridiales bacterium]|nr:hypothetical protein [Clostridiales bacterium]
MKFYHATKPETAVKIASDGVIKARFGEVFLCGDKYDACKFLLIRGVKEIMVIGVDLPQDAVKESFDHSESFFQCKAFVHDGDVELDGKTTFEKISFDL